MKKFWVIFAGIALIAIGGISYASDSDGGPAQTGKKLWGDFKNLLHGLQNPDSVLHFPHPSEPSAPAQGSAPAPAPAAPSAPSAHPDSLPATCSSTGSQKLAVILVSYPGAVTPMASLDYMRQLFVGTQDAQAPSVKDYYSTVSEGKLSFDHIDLYGPYMLANTYSLDPAHADPDGEGIDDYEQALFAAAKQDVHLEQYDRLLFVAPAILNSSTGQPYEMAAGLSSTDCTSEIFSDGRVSKAMGVSWILNDQRYSGIDPSRIASPDIWNNWPPAQRAAAIQKVEITDMAPLIHEIGHTFGLGHANGIDDPSDTLPDEATPMRCMFYEDYYDVMASSVTAPFDIPHRDYLGWLSDGELQTVQSSGTYRLYPSDANGPGLKGIEIPRIKSANDPTLGKIWVEYRTGTNLYEEGGVGQSAPYNGAIVHYTNPKQAYTSDDFHWPNETLILDYSPGHPTPGLNTNLILRGSWHDQHSLVGLDVVAITPQYMDVRVSLDSAQ